MSKLKPEAQNSLSNKMQNSSCPGQKQERECSFTGKSPTFQKRLPLVAWNLNNTKLWLSSLGKEESEQKDKKRLSSPVSQHNSANNSQVLHTEDVKPNI
jgi:hypothetical protein